MQISKSVLTRERQQENKNALGVLHPEQRLAAMGS
jgi:hypothetical protein